MRRRPDARPGSAVRLAAVSGLAALLAACAAAPARIDDLGGGVLAMTKRSNRVGSDVLPLKTALEEEAATYCKGRAGAVEIFDSRAVAANPPDFAYATLQFRCVAP